MRLRPHAQPSQAPVNRGLRLGNGAQHAGNTAPMPQTKSKPDGGQSTEFATRLASNPPFSVDDFGKEFPIKATIKAHDEYKGRKQTSITRAKINLPKSKAA